MMKSFEFFFIFIFVSGFGFSLLFLSLKFLWELCVSVPLWVLVSAQRTQFRGVVWIFVRLEGVSF